MDPGYSLFMCCCHYIIHAPDRVGIKPGSPFVSPVLKPVGGIKVCLASSSHYSPFWNSRVKTATPPPPPPPPPPTHTHTHTIRAPWFWSYTHTQTSEPPWFWSFSNKAECFHSGEPDYRCHQYGPCGDRNHWAIKVPVGLNHVRLALSLLRS